MTSRSTSTACGGAREALEVLEREPLAHVGRVAERAPDDRGLLAEARVVDDDLHAGSGRPAPRAAGRCPRTRSGSAWPCTRNGCGTRERLAADRHLVLLHDLEQRRLHLGGRAVDLVGEQEVAEDRAELGVEACRCRGGRSRVPTRSAGTRSGVNWMRRKRAAEHLGERLDGQRLGQAGHALEQHVAAGEQRDEQALEHRVLADDDALDLVQRLLERGGGSSRRACGGSSLGGHVVGLLSFGQIRRPNQRRDMSGAEQQQQRARRPRTRLVTWRCSFLWPSCEPSSCRPRSRLVGVGGGEGLAARGARDLARAPAGRAGRARVSVPPPRWAP